MRASKKDYIAIAAIIKAEIDSAKTWLSEQEAIIGKGDGMMLNGGCSFTDIEDATACENQNIARVRKLCAERLAGNMATLFASQNPQFSRDRFLQACGVAS